MNKKIFFIVFVITCSCIGLVVLLPNRERSIQVGTGSMAQAEMTLPAITQRSPASSNAQARALAWLGGQQDGITQNALDSEAQAYIPEMKRMLKQHKPEKGLGLATITPQGIHRLIGNSIVDIKKMDAAQEQLRLLRQELEHNAETKQEIINPKTTQARMNVAMGYELHAHPGCVQRSEQDGSAFTISGSGVWAALPAVSGREQLRISVSEGTGLYGIAIIGDGFEHARIDGGLIIPNRFYALGNGRVVSGADGVDVLIRPLSALQFYYLEAILPQNNG